MHKLTTIARCNNGFSNNSSILTAKKYVDKGYKNGNDIITVKIKK